MKKSLIAALIAFCFTLCMCYAQKKTASHEEAKKALIDYDLTRYSPTMVYSTVFDMMMNPERYEGKTVRMHGTFDVFEYEEGGKKHQSYACVIQDATACCAQGMEFTLKDGKSYPADYPQIGAECTVTGRYHVDEVDGLSYIRLVESELEG